MLNIHQQGFERPFADNPGATKAFFNSLPERYRGQYAHFAITWLPFLGMMALVILLKLLEPLLPEAVTGTVLAVIGLAFTVYVLRLPLTWKRWRARGRLELHVGRGRFRLIEPLSGESVGAGRSVAETAEYHYRVDSRFAGGTYRAPAFLLTLDGGKTITLGVVGSPLTWAGPLPVSGRPHYRLEAASLIDCAAAFGLAGRLATVTEARVR